MRKLDSQEFYIVKQLVRNPRISDNRISRNTGIPLRTVNRKRKKLEQDGLLSYFAYLHTFTDGLGHFEARCLVTIKLKYGITRGMLQSSFDNEDNVVVFNSKHIFESHIGESNGHAVLVMIIESMRHEDILEILNAETIPNLRKSFGEDAISDIQVIGLTLPMRMLHNYIPGRNVKNGKIIKGWDDKFIYVDK